MARIVNALELKLHHAHFWGMDEWIENGGRCRWIIRSRSPRPTWSCASIASARELRMPDENIHFPLDLDAYSQSYDEVRCLVMQGGQGEVKHWAFNDPPQARRPVAATSRRRRPSIASSKRGSPTCTR